MNSWSANDPISSSLGSTADSDRDGENSCNTDSGSESGGSEFGDSGSGDSCSSDSGGGDSSSSSD